MHIITNPPAIYTIESSYTSYCKLLIDRIHSHHSIGSKATESLFKINPKDMSNRLEMQLRSDNPRREEYNICGLIVEEQSW